MTLIYFAIVTKLKNILQVKMAEEKKNVSKKNWADEEDDGAEEEDVEIGGSSVAQVGQTKASEAANAEG